MESETEITVKIMIWIIVIVIAAAGLFFLTPLGFGRISLDGEYRVKIRVNGREMTATMENNTSARAFKKVLTRGPKTIGMRDYGSMEKVGMLGRRYPTNNRQIRTAPGDIILYMGSALVVYYNVNSWNFTKLGHIDGMTQKELKEILGKGSVKMTFELLP